MMAQQAWPLGSDLAGVGTAMITCRAVPAPVPAHIGVSQISQTTTSQDFADPPGSFAHFSQSPARLVALGRSAVSCWLPPLQSYESSS
jgi:hypothetical protein